ncbi:hypothetical protein B296_00043588 [Ensete ventricosum]|uniref:DUF834 domain-containing protein n=1 Tax=Ensete ventricosum TaxID=4639 RepID=A0A426Z5H3_ENSVE|nr:hypothetical protein B296_00043588 [Ensete ventricosum]
MVEVDGRSGSKRMSGSDYDLEIESGSDSKVMREGGCGDVVRSSREVCQRGEGATTEEEATDDGLRAAATIRRGGGTAGQQRYGRTTTEKRRAAIVAGTDGSWEITTESKGRKRAAMASGWSKGCGGCRGDEVTEEEAIAREGQR